MDSTQTWPVTAGAGAPAGRDPHPLLAWFEADASRTRAGLAKMLDVHPSRITQIIAGAMPSLPVAVALSRATGISIEDLFAAAKGGAPRC